jgi:uncharacterized repeat protein (TIGR01451 family)
MGKYHKRKWLNVLLAVVILLSTFLPSLSAYAEDLNGLLVNIQNESGEPLQNGRLILFEKRNPDPWSLQYSWARYYINEIFASDVVDGEVFIPNAYLLEGKEYSLLVQGLAADGKPILYHHVFTPNQSSELTLGNDTLSNVSLTTDTISFTDGTLAIQPVDNDEQAIAYPYPLQLNDGVASVYLSSNAQVQATALLFDENSRVGYLLNKKFTLANEENQAISLETELVEITAPIVESGTSSLIVADEWYSNFYAQKYFVTKGELSGFRDNDIYMRYEIFKDDYTYEFYKWSREALNEDYQIQHFNQLSGYVHFDEAFGVGTQDVEAYIGYHNEEDFYLSHVRELAPASPTSSDLYFFVPNDDGSLTKKTATITGSGVQYETVQDGGAANPIELEYQIKNSNNEPVGPSIVENSVGWIEMNMPTVAGDYTLNLVRQSFPTNIAELSLSEEFTLGSGSGSGSGSETPGLATIEVPDGYVIERNYDIDARVWFVDDNYTNDYYVNITSDKKVNLLNTWLDSNREYVLHVSATLKNTMTNERVLYHTQNTYTYEELMNLTEIPLEENLVKVKLDLTNVSADERNSVSYGAYINESHNRYFVILDHLYGSSGKELWASPGTKFKVFYNGVDSANHNAFSVSKSVTLDSGMTSIDISDAFTGLKEVKVVNGETQVPLKTFMVFHSGVNRYTTSGYYANSNEDDYFNSLFVTPGNLRFHLGLVKKEANETPWYYEWSTGYSDINDTKVFNYTGTIDDKEINNIQTNEQNDGTYSVWGNASLRSGDLQLRRVSVFREHYQDFQSNHHEMAYTVGENGEVTPDREYSGEFDNMQQLYATVKLKDATDKTLLKGDTSGTSFDFRTMLEPGTYKVAYELPIAPRTKVALEGTFEIAAGVQKPEVTVSQVQAGLNISWQEDEAAAHYTVKVGKKGHGLSTFKTNYIGNSVTYSNVEEGTYYEVQVIAYNNANRTQQSDVVEFLTKGIYTELTTDTHRYVPGSNVTLSGKVLNDGNPGKGTKPTLTVKDPSGNVVYTNQWNDNEIGTDGSISDVFGLDNNAPLGYYSVTLAAGTKKTEVYFQVVETLTEKSVTIETNKYSYYPGNEVTITGEVKIDGEAVRNTDVTILVTKDGNHVKADQVSTNNEGEYEARFVLPTGESALGEYKVSVASIGKTSYHYIYVSEADVPVLTKPLNDFRTNKNEIEFRGYAIENTDLVVEAYLGNATTPEVSREVTSNDNGYFSGKLTLTGDGQYKLIVKHKDDATIVSEHVSFVLDTTAPVNPELEVEASANGLLLTWTQDSDVAYYDVYAAEDDNDFSLIKGKTNELSYVYKDVKPDTTYKFKVVAYDSVGNVTESSVVTFETDAFTATSLVVDYNDVNGYLVMGSTINLELKGSYNQGYKAYAAVTFVKDGAEKTTTLTLDYNEEKEAYVKGFFVQEGITSVTKAEGYIEDGSNNKTNTVTEEINKQVGATVTGTVTRGNALVASGTVSMGSYKADIGANGTYKLEGIAPGKYSVNVKYDGQNYFNLVTGYEVKLAKKQILSLTIPVYKDVKIKFVDQNDEEVTASLTIDIISKSDSAYTRSGFIGNSGLFTTWFGQEQLSNLKAGWYIVKVYGNSRYNNATAEVYVDPSSEVNHLEVPLSVTVSKKEEVVKDVTLTFAPEAVDNIDYLYLYNWDVYYASNYTEGYYYLENVTLDENNQVVIEDVLVNNYNLYVHTSDYRPYSAEVDLTTATELTVTLDKGLTVTGTLKTNNGSAVVNPQVYAYTATSYGYGEVKADGSFAIKGLASDEDVTYYISALDVKTVEGPLTPVSTDVENDSIDLGEITLEAAKYIEGKVYDKDANPVKHVYIDVFVVNADGSLGAHQGFARTDKDGYFKVRGLEVGEYQIQTWKNNYPSVTTETISVTVEESPNVEITLQEQGTGDFSGEGNSLAASTATVIPGKTIQYQLSYKNNGTADVANVPLEVTVPGNATLIGKSVLLNGKAVTLVNGKVTVPTVKAGETGKLTFEVTVKADTAEAVRTTATINNNAENTAEVLATTTNVLFVTINAPEMTAEKKIKVYGNAKANTTVEVYADNVRVAEVKADGRWWFADVTLPVKGTDAQSFNLYAKIKETGQVTQSKVIAVEYSPNIPKLTDVKVHAGWNGEVSLNPYTGVATFAVVEKTPMDATLVFDQEIDEVSISFLDKTYKLETTDKKTFTFNGHRLGDWSSYGEQLLEVTFKKGDITITLPLMEIIVLIDPSGFVFEGSMDNKLEGVTAVVQEQQADSTWKQWEAKKFGQINPQVTDAKGHYGWDVIAGNWRVLFSKDGYDAYTSRIVVVPPPETQLNVPMVRSTAPVIESISVTNNATNVSTTPSIEIIFDRPMDKVSVESFIKLQSNGEIVELDSFVFEKIYNGYKVDESKAQSGLLDSKGQSGWFVEDDTKKLVKKVTITPKTALAEGKTYTLSVGGNIIDYDGKQVGTDVVRTFTTKTPTSSENYVPTTPPTQVQGGITLNVDGKVSNVDITAQLNDDKKNEVVIELAESGKADVTVGITKDFVAKLLDKKKALVINTKDATVTLTTANLKDFANKDVKVVVNVADDSKGQNFVSKVYDFTVTADSKVVTNFNESVKVTLKVNVSTIKDKRKAAAYYLNEKTNKWEYVGGSLNTDGTFTFQAKHFSKYAVIENDKSFNDIGALAWAKDSIEVLASRTIIQGVTAEKFAPGEEVTRAQFAVLLARALNLPVGTYEGMFKDVSQNAWYALQVESLYRAGITNAKDSYGANDTITREQMATMIIRALNYQNNQALNNVTGSLSFEDASNIAPYAKDNVAKAAKLGIIKGMTNGTFAPTASATRAETAVMLYRLLIVTGDIQE